MEDAYVIKEGKLLKKGEFISTWRPRWFILRSDGTFRGYKNRPMSANEPPVNLFDVADCSVSLVDDVDKTKFGFVIRFVQLTRIIERSFHTEAADERQEWVDAIVELKTRLEGVNGPTSSAVREYRAMSYISGRPEPIEIDMDHFDLMKVLGRGTFGKVFLCRMKTNGRIYAMKVLKKSMVLEKDELIHTLTENKVLSKCNHQFLTSLHFSFQTDSLLCFVMEYVNGGELFFHLRKEKRFSEDRVRFYVAEILSALTYLHDEGIIYRDLKLENVMLSSKGHIKLTDFGLAKEEINYGDKTTTFVGTPEYLAPEIIVDADYGRAVDWWSLGVITYEMIAGELPFNSRDYEELFNLILTQEITCPSFFSDEVKNLVLGLLEREPSLRLGGGLRDGHEIKEHPWFQSINFDDLEKLKIEPPFVPKVKGSDDTGNFDPYFTREEAKLSPSDLEAIPEAAQQAFKNFEVRND